MSFKPSIIIDADAEAVCRRLAADLAGLAARGGAVALSGGSTPKLLFDTIARDFPRAPWVGIAFFWGDERMVPESSPESNWGEFARRLVATGVVPREACHPILFDGDEKRALAEFEASLRVRVPWSRGLPRFSLAILGIGPDGHTASIFPDNLQSFDSSAPAEFVTRPQDGVRRVTLTGSALNNSVSVAFLATGAGKREILRRVLSRDAALPASHIHPLDGTLAFRLDRAARPAIA